MPKYLLVPAQAAVGTISARTAGTWHNVVIDDKCIAERKFVFSAVGIGDCDRSAVIIECGFYWVNLGGFILNINDFRHERAGRAAAFTICVDPVAGGYKADDASLFIKAQRVHIRVDPNGVWVKGRQCPDRRPELDG